MHPDPPDHARTVRSFGAVAVLYLALAVPAAVVTPATTALYRVDPPAP